MAKKIKIEIYPKFLIVFPVTPITLFVTICNKQIFTRMFVCIRTRAIYRLKM